MGRAGPARWMLMGLALAVSAPAFPAGDAALAWLDRDSVAWRRLDGGEGSAMPPYQRVPLGSLWKLFIYAYAVETGLKEQPYRCGPRSAPGEDEEYCCDPGQTVSRDLALARSCGPYFEPARLRIDAAQWKRFWAARAGTENPWLARLADLRPEREVTPLGLLHALAAVPPVARDRARQALIGVSLNGYARESLALLGTGPRLKTYTWRHPARPGIRFGGAAGWLADGTPFWFGASGSSRSALARWAPGIARALAEAGKDGGNGLAASYAGEPCARVDFFTRYPLRRVSDAEHGRDAGLGPLQGRYRIDFANGNHLMLESHGQLELERKRERLEIQGRFALNDYVARVLDREADPGESEAARSLAIVARSYLLQNGRVESGCYRIADDSRTQRVSPNPPSREALRAAWFSDGLVLRGTAVRYHLDQGGPGMLAWRRAVSLGRESRHFNEILEQAFPNATLASLGGLEDCSRQPAAERWLNAAQSRWARQLMREAGFEPVREAIAVCQLDYGHPYSDQRRMRIYARSGMERQDRLTLAHEYLHLAFRFHPNGLDENYVERWARKLIDG